jgi:hypothetical protein
MYIEDFRENDAVEALYARYQDNKITAEEFGRGILLHAAHAGESEEARVERQATDLSPLAEALRMASAADVVLALAYLEADNRPGFQFDVGIELYHADPVKVLPGPGPYALYDDPDHGFVTVSAFDPARRVDAIKGIRYIRNGATTMEAVAFLKGLESQAVEVEYHSKRDAERAQRLWESYGFTASISGFGATRNATTHTVRLQDWGRAAPC